MKQTYTAGKAGGLGLFFLIYFFFWMASNTLDPYLGVFYESRGLTGTQIGMAASLFSVATVVGAPVGGVIEDFLDRPSRVVTLLVLGMITCVGLLCISRAALPIFLMVFLYGVCYAPVNGIVDTVLIDTLDGASERFSFYRTGGTAGAGAGVLLAGVLFDGVHFLPVFAAFGGLAALCALCAWHMPQGRGAPVQRPAPADYLALARSPYFLPIYFTMALWGMTESSALQFLALHITSLGFPLQLTSICIAAAMAGELLTFLYTPRLCRRFSRRRLLAVSFLLQFLRVGSTALLAHLPPPLVVLFHFTGGGSYALLYTIMTAIIGEVYPAKTRYSAQVLKLVASRGIGMTCGSMLLGAMFDMQMTAAGYQLLAMAAGAAAVYFLLPFRRRGLL